jgi:phospholipid/cholesterol/gamma-HCH transport system substrate-binding protein
MINWRRRCAIFGLGALVAATALAGCGWRGLNSIALPGTAGGGPGSYEIQAQLPDVGNMQQNSRVLVGDVNVGNVTKIQRQGWHALVTIRLAGDVTLPGNATATVGQTSLLGSLHVELASPTNEPPRGRLHNGSLIPLSSGSAYPTTEQTLAAVAMLLNGGGIGQLQEITTAFATAFAGREDDLRSLLDQLNQFIAHANTQTHDIIGASESLNKLAGEFAEQKPVMDRALQTIPAALDVLATQRDNLAEALTQLGRFSALAANSINQTKEALVKELTDLGPVLESLANAGPAMTRSLSMLATYPWTKELITKFVRGDYANLTAIFDMTLSRLDNSLLTGTRWEGNLTELEMQWGRTIGQIPSPYTAANPLIVPYHFDQGP